MIVLTLISLIIKPGRAPGGEQEQGNQFNQMWESKDGFWEYDIITMERDLYNFENYHEEDFDTREQEGNININFNTDGHRF